MSFNKDTDREILSHITNEELLKVCSINKYFWYKVCDDAFLKRRLLSKYPNIEKYKLNGETWKQFFLRSIHYIALLKENFDYTYVSGDFDRQYYIFNNTKKKGKIILNAAIYGEIELVIYCIENENPYLKYIDKALKYSSQNGYFEIVKYLVENGAYHHKSISLASLNGHLEIVNFLVENAL